MTVSEKVAPQPQFRVEIDGETGYGTKVFFEGAEVVNVTGVKVENDIRVDDVIRGRLIIDLCEPVLVITTGVALP